MELIPRDTYNPSVFESGMLALFGPLHSPRALPLLSTPLQQVDSSVRQVRAEDPMAASDKTELLAMTFIDPLLKGITGLGENGQTTL